MGKDKMKVHCLFEQSGTFKNEFKKLGFQAYDYDILNDVQSTGTGFMTTLIIDPEQDEDDSKMLDWHYYQVTGIQIDTKGQYGKHAYYNSFTGKHDFFAVSLPKAMPLIRKRMQTHLIRRG